MTATLSIETEYQQRLAKYLSFVKEHKNHQPQTLNKSGMLVRCLSCEAERELLEDVNEDGDRNRFTNELQFNICKICNSNEVSPLNHEQICGSCVAEGVVYDFEFGEAKEKDTWTSAFRTVTRSGARMPARSLPMRAPC